MALNNLSVQKIWKMWCCFLSLHSRCGISISGKFPTVSKSKYKFNYCSAVMTLIIISLNIFSVYNFCSTDATVATQIDLMLTVQCRDRKLNKSVRSNSNKTRGNILKNRIKRIYFREMYRVRQQIPDAIQKRSLNKADIWKVVIFTHTSTRAVSWPKQS